jgi:hypothetical protein
LGNSQAARSDYNQSVLLNPQYAQTNYIQNSAAYYNSVVLYNPYCIGGYYDRGAIVYYSPGYVELGVGIYSRLIVSPIIQVSPRRWRGENFFLVRP